ncbi:MAG TPA: S41 family peptidase, partial [Chitinophagaceae bacterium]|nr:S41 family peptidase [Chitinophagaceae bacterium]
IRDAMSFTFCYLSAMRKLLIWAAYLFSYQCLLAQQLTTQQYRQDFEYFWTTIRDNYSYWDKKQTDWEKVKTVYQPLIDTITSKGSFIGILEQVFYELYDHHASLNTNTPESQRLVPSGADLWAEYVNGKPTIIEVKGGSGAELAGLRRGMRVDSFNEVPLERAILHLVPKCLKKPDDEAKNYALRLLLAGKHSERRKITAISGKQKKEYLPDAPVNLLETRHSTDELEFKILKGNVGYILVSNSLGNNDLIRLFDSAITALQHTKAMIIDLRNTPSGGNTSVARAMLGRFISKEGFYQKHELPSEQKETGIKRSWVEIASPRAPVYKNLLVVLVDHWTGSVGEGIAIGFDALKRAAIIGTKMAGLNGAVYSFTMPNTGIGFSFPAEKLYHVNGIPREKFRPAIEIDLSNKRNNEDLILKEALKYVSHASR